VLPAVIDQDVLLLLRNVDGTPYIPPIEDALRSAWPGTVLSANYRQVTMALGAQFGVRIDGRAVTPARVYARMCGTPMGSAVARALEMLGSAVVNSTASVALADSKWHTAMALAGAGLPVPDQQLIACSDGPADLATIGALGWPLVLKSNSGFGGQEVWLVADQDQLRARLDARPRPDTYLAQQFRPEAAGVDTRILVMGGQVVAAMQRRSSTGDFRSNLSQGGVATRHAPSAGELALAVAAAAAVGLRIAGIDLLTTTDGPMIIEVNANPSLAAHHALGPDDAVYERLAAAVIEL